MRIYVLSALRRKRRINALVEEVAFHERQMRNAVSQLIELTVQDDDLHTVCKQLLEALDG